MRTRLILVGEPSVVIPGALHAEIGDFLQRGFDQIRQFQILEKDVEKFVPRQGKLKIVFAVAGIACLLSALPGTTARLSDLVSRYIFLVAWKDPFACPAIVRQPKTRFLCRLRGDRDFLTTAGVGDFPVFQRFLYGFREFHCARGE